MLIPTIFLSNKAALTKLSYVLSKSEWSLEEKRQKMMTNTNGEMTVLQRAGEEDLASASPSAAKGTDLKLVQAVAKSLSMQTFEELKGAEEVLLPSILCSAAFQGSVDSLEAMSQNHGADLAASDYDKRTPLHVASSEGDTSVNYII